MYLRSSAAFGRGLRRTPAGFTLVEILIVIAMIGILAAIALPRFNLRGYTANSTAGAVASSLGYAQRLAVSLQHDVVVAFDAGGNRLRVHEDANNNLAVDPGERVRSVPLENGMGFGRSGVTALPALGPADVSFSRLQDGMPSVTFHRDGSASEDGGFYLSFPGADPGHEVVRAVLLSRPTGRASWQQWTGSTWKER